MNVSELIEQLSMSNTELRLQFKMLEYDQSSIKTTYNGILPDNLEIAITLLTDKVDPDFKSPKTLKFLTSLTPYNIKITPTTPPTALSDLEEYEQLVKDLDSECTPIAYTKSCYITDKWKKTGNKLLHHYVKELYETILYSISESHREAKHNPSRPQYKEYATAVCNLGKKSKSDNIAYQMAYDKVLRYLETNFY